MKLPGLISSVIFLAARRDDPRPLFDILRAAARTVERATTIAEGRNGGYFCIAAQNGTPLVVACLGSIPGEKTGKYSRLAMEKARRLGQNPGQRSSWQSRAPSEDKWGGAVRIGRGRIVSFSGFPETLDEAAMLVTGIICDELADDEAIAIAAMSDNAQFIHLWALVENANASC